MWTNKKYKYRKEMKNLYDTHWLLKVKKNPIIEFLTYVEIQYMTTKAHRVRGGNVN